MTTPPDPGSAVRAVLATLADPLEASQALRASGALRDANALVPTIVDLVTGMSQNMTEGDTTAARNFADELAHVVLGIQGLLTSASQAEATVAGIRLTRDNVSIDDFQRVVAEAAALPRVTTEAGR